MYWWKAINPVIQASKHSVVIFIINYTEGAVYKLQQVKLLLLVETLVLIEIGSQCKINVWYVN